MQLISFTGSCRKWEFRVNDIIIPIGIPIRISHPYHLTEAVMYYPKCGGSGNCRINECWPQDVCEVAGEDWNTPPKGQILAPDSASPRYNLIRGRGPFLWRPRRACAKFHWDYFDICLWGGCWANPCKTN